MAVAGKKHSKIQFDPYENQWRIEVMNNPNISATSYASMNTKAIGRKSPKAEYVPAFTFQDYTSGRWGETSSAAPRTRYVHTRRFYTAAQYCAGAYTFLELLCWNSVFLQEWNLYWSSLQVPPNYPNDPTSLTTPTTQTTLTNQTTPTNWPSWPGRIKSWEPNSEAQVLFRCDYKNDCPDKSDESNCEVVTNYL